MWKILLCVQEVRAMCDAPKDAEVSVREWLVGHGVSADDVMRVSSSLRVTAHYSVVQRLFPELEPVCICIYV